MRTEQTAEIITSLRSLANEQVFPNGASARLLRDAANQIEAEGASLTALQNMTWQRDEAIGGRTFWYDAFKAVEKGRAIDQQRLAEVTRELDEAKAETERQHGHRFRLAGEVGSLRAALDSQTQRACRFNCDAESKNCSCAAHVARNEVLAALAAPAAGTPEQAAPEHVCGLAGYDGMIDKPCPACEFYRVKRAAAGTEPTAPAADPQE